MAKNSYTTGASSRDRALALLLALCTAGNPAVAAAASPTIPGFYGQVPMPAAPVSGTLPALRPGGTLAGAEIGGVLGSTLTINQTQAQATIDWSSFNIAPDSVVIFNQKQGGVPQSQWTALNRIHDANPSLVFGKIQADGKVYLINRNGILFGPGSQVNLHSLVASNLNITDANFQNGKLRFTTDPYDAGQVALSNDAYVSNYGTIETGSGGSVFLVGPNAVNAGKVSAPSGKISLIGAREPGDGTAGEVEAFALTVDAAGQDVSYSDLNAAGDAYNAAGGSLSTDAGGRINMYGRTVRTDGLIRAVTAFKKGGVVVLAARDRVTTGEESLIESPIERSAETADPQFNFKSPEVIFQGLSTDAKALNPLKVIEHEGAIVAPSGKITLTASDRIYLGEGSSIDVSGLWLDRQASANVMEAQLNSVDLRDYYGQKGGVLLGQKVYVDTLTGSGIGNIDNGYLTRQTGAEERSTAGGSINFSNPTDLITLDQLIVKQGALLDFSGGGIRYASGTMATSRLVSGNRIYGIGSAPQWVAYDSLADSQSRSSQRFGVTEKFSGLYFGGGSAVRDLTSSRVVGSDAGSVVFNARVSVLDGSLVGGVTRGQYQTAVTDYAVKDFGASDYRQYAISVVRGLEEAKGGSVTVGSKIAAQPSSTTEYDKNPVTESIVVEAGTTSLSSAFGVDDPLDEAITSTRLSTALLNGAGLGSLNLFAAESIRTEAGAEIALLPGGSYVARSSSIDFMGKVTVPGGTVEMTTRPVVSADSVNSIRLASGSSVSTAGERIDNSSLQPVSAGNHISGGSILIQERGEGGTSAALGSSSTGQSLVVADGALLDVSGGWLIDRKGNVSGGDAGTLELKGNTLSLAGELRGHSLPGKNGGEIKLHAGEVVVASSGLVLPENLGADQPIPDYLLGRLVLGEDQLAQTGFARISLSAIEDVSFRDGAILTPSLEKLSMPVPAMVSEGAVGNLVLPAGSDPTAADYLGKSSIAITAGSNIFANSYNAGGEMAADSASATIELTRGAGVKVAQGGSVEFSAPNVEVAGRIEALGGEVTLTSDYALRLKSGSEILAGGYSAPPSSTLASISVGPSPQRGGTVALTSTLSDLLLEAGSLVDVSGAAPVERLTAGADGVPVRIAAAGDPGTLELSYAGELTLDGVVDGRPRMEGIQGGSLSITKLANDLTVRAADIDRYQQNGFDAITLKSLTGALLFQESMDVAIGRSLTLDGKEIRGAQGVDVALSSPWITVQNSTVIRSGSPGALDLDGGTLKLAGGYLDVKGSVLLDGFSDVSLEAERDLTFGDRTYTVGSDSKYWAGDLGVSGELTLQAARIYPTTATDFTVTTPGKATILPAAAGDPTPVYSAGGSLTIAADGGIEHRGTLAAPQGSVTLDGGETGRVVLAQGSSIDTAGSAAVSYGNYDGSFWKVKADEFNNGGSEIVSAPESSVTLKGDEVVAEEGSSVNVSGGGSVFVTNFQSGIPGSTNPLAPSTGRYVILADNSVRRPGAAVYLDAAPEFGLAAGVYSLLPAEEFAFAPGALVVQATGVDLVPGQRALSGEGYRVVAGYKTVTDTSIGSQARDGYSIRYAADVLREGDFSDQRKFASQDGGDFTLTATSAVLNGSLRGEAMQGHQGGVLTLGAKNVVVQNEAPVGSIVDETLVLNTASVSDKGFAELVLGSQAYNGATPVETTVTVKEGTTLQASSVTLKANSAVTVEKDAKVVAAGAEGSGTVTVDVSTGTFTLNEGGDVRASHGLSFNVGDMQLDGSFGADNSTLSLAADKIVFAADGVSQAPGALYLTDSRWEQFNSYEDLTIKSRSDIEFRNDVDLLSAGSLTLDAPALTGTATSSTVTLAAATTLTLTSTGKTSSATPVAGTTVLTLKGDEIVVAPRQLSASSQGSLVLDRFASVSLESDHDLVLSGAGSLKTGGDLDLTAARVTTSYYKHDADPSNKSDVAVPYIAAAITLAAAGDVAVKGNGVEAGTTATPGGSLSITGASITVGNTEPVKDADGAPVLDSDGNPVFNATVLEVPSGQLRLSAAGDIVVTGKTSILATGSKSEMPMQEEVYSYGPAGSIALESDTGAIRLTAGSTLDVSASDEGNAGSVSLSAAAGSVTLAGTLKGSAPAGQGGSFAIDGEALAFVDQDPDGTPNLDDTGWLNGLSSRLDAGGFNDRIDIRSRSGNLALTDGNTLTGRDVTVAADGADITITGTVNADTADGSGRIELYAGKNLTLGDKGKLTAMGTGDGSDGGSILLSSQDGSDNAETFNGSYTLTVAGGSTIDVSSHDADGTGGTVHFRAYQGKRSTGDATLNDVNMAAVQGTINGASAVTVEAVKAENFTADTVLKQADLDAYLAAADTFMNSAADLLNKGTLTGVRTGIEIATAAGKTLTVGDATATVALSLVARPGGSPVVLTLKSGGDLKIVQSLTDAPTARATLYSSTMQKSTALNLVAGYDGGAYYLGTAGGIGNLSIDSGKWVYTENAPIRFAAGNDATFSGTSTSPNLMINADMKYNLGSYGGTVRGTVGNDLKLTGKGSAIQTALGDIELKIGRNLDLGSQGNTGAIRTTGEYDNSTRIEAMPGTGTYSDAGSSSYWTYQNGGAISLDVAGSINGNLSKDNGWDGAYYDDRTIISQTDFRLSNYPWYLAAGFGGNKEKAQSANIPVTVGIATMGGGDISVRTGGALLTQIGAFGTRNTGNLTVTSGGDMTGRFRVMEGTAILTSGGSFGKDSSANPTWKSVVEMGDAKVRVTAQGDVALGAVLNPDNTRDRIFQSSSNKWNMTYSMDAAASISSLSGDLTLFGEDGFNAYNFTGNDGLKSSLLVRQRILPASVSLSAAADMTVSDDFYLAPSQTGNLALYAGGDIAGLFKGIYASGFRMVDVRDISGYYGRETDTGNQLSSAFTTEPDELTSRASVVNHLGDLVPVTIRAGGDIDTLKLVLNKQSVTTAAGDIANLDLIGQNVDRQSVTLVSAEGSIDQGIVTGNTSVIKVGGPGTLVVEAGKKIDLGNSKGIESIGNSFNSAFTGEHTDSNIIVTVGANTSLLPADGSAAASLAASLFETLRQDGEDYSRLKAEGKEEEALAALAHAREGVVEYFDPPAEGTGNLTMVDSLVRSRKGDIYLLAESDVNVGRSNISSSAAKKDTGITTTFGGNLSIFTGGDLNVNESRTMTFMGGDIVIWSDIGDINAGRGSKTALSGSDLGVVEERDPVTNVLFSLLYPAPALGSGVRASTYDPDGSTGPRQMPEPGNVYLFAPTGIIDAGEAGIAGGNVILGATQVLNAGNISFSAGSVGVPTSDASINLGALAGNSGLSDSAKATEQASGLAPVKEKAAKEKNALEEFFSKWLDLRILSFDEPSVQDDDEEEKQQQKKK